MNVHQMVRSTGRSWSMAIGSIGLGVWLMGAGTARADEKMDEALARGAQFLVSQQDPGSGSISIKGRNQTAMTALSILVMAALGHQPSDSTATGQSMRKALDFVLKGDTQQPDGYFGQKDNSRMYGHGIITLMLAEMLGMGADAQQDELIREKCLNAIRLIQRAQKVPKSEKARGGWRYTPDDSSSDMSVTVWQVMALRAAKNAGMDVSKDAIDDAVSYIKGLYDPETESKGKQKLGGFGYQNKGRETSTTAEGLLALQVCGEYESAETLGAAERLFQEGVRADERWFYYTTYYYAQGMYQRGGKYAELGRRRVAESLLPLQSREGFWEQGGGDGREAGKIYATSLAILSLAVKNHFLPIYQR